MHAASQRSLRQDDDTVIVMDDVSIFQHMQTHRKCGNLLRDIATPALFGVWAVQHFMAPLG